MTYCQRLSGQGHGAARRPQMLILKSGGVLLMKMVLLDRAQ